MTPGPDREPESAGSRPNDLFAIDRELGWLISVCGPLLMVGMTVPELSDAADFAGWWNVAGAVLAAAIVVAALVGRRLPAPLLRRWWVIAPSAGAVLFATSFLAYRGPDPGAVVPWAWTFEAILVTYLALWLPVWPAIGGAVVSGLLPALSGLLVLGHVPAAVAAQTPIHVSNLAFVVLFAGMRGRLVRLRAAERQARDVDERRVRAATDTEHRRRLAALVHDDVLSVLTAATAFTGRPPAALRAEASRALDMLEPGPKPNPGDRSLDTTAARDHLLAVLAAIDPRCPVQARCEPGTAPADVVDGVVAAAAEAVRNSLRHAGTDTPRGVDATVTPTRIRVEIKDQGGGFDPTTVDPTRLGVRGSITARMRSIPGGEATIDARAGHGTRVVVTWQCSRDG